MREWQWCHRNTRNSLGSGAQCIFMQRQAPLPCYAVIKSKVTKECDLGHVDFHEIGGENNIGEQKSKDIPVHMPTMSDDDETPGV